MFLITDTFCFKVSVIAISISIHHHNKKRKDILPLFSCFKDRFKAQCLRLFAKDAFRLPMMSLLMIFEKIPPTAPK